MPRITFTLPDGSSREVEGEEGLTVMHAALAARVPGIDADCYGDCACATCHVHVAEPWLSRLGPANAEERCMLSEAAGLAQDSRLACQIPVSAGTDGIIVRIPA
jgi:2Fe-2S ferredoxin